MNNESPKALNAAEGKLAFDELSKVVRKISFGNCPEYLWGEGTAFIVSYREEHYVVTARHNVLKGGENLAEHIWITVAGTRIIVPFDRFLLVKLDDECEDSQDFLVFHVNARRAAESGVPGLHSIDIESRYISGTSVKWGDPLRFAGYPTVEEPYDHELKRSYSHMMIGDAVHENCFLGENFGTLRVEPSSRNFSGMSGGVVLALKGGHYYWAGMVILGTSSSGILHYMKADFIVRAIANDYWHIRPISTG